MVGPVLRNVFTKTLRDQRRAQLWWAAGLLAVIAVYVAPYRQYLEQGALNINTDSGLYQALGYDNSPAGYLQGTLFALTGPLLLIMAAATAGARAIAGDEEAGMLELLLAHPVSRTRLVLQRFAALAVTCAWLGLVVWAGTVAAAGAADLGIGVGPIGAATLGLVLLGLGFGTLALAAGAVAANRAAVLGVTAALAVAAYLAYTVGSQVEALASVRRLSPFSWYLGGDPLRSGLDAGGLALLAAVPLVALGVALWSLNRRDVAV
jgi:ABC-2 type transport system permease protein